MKTSTRLHTLARAAVLGAFAALAATPAVAQQEEDPSPQQESSQQERMQETDRQQQGESLMAVAEGRSDISLFVQAVKRAGLQNELEQNGPYTVFAPTNDALREHFDEDELDRLLGSSSSERAGQQADERDRAGEQPTHQDTHQLLRLVRSHIVSGEWTTGQLQNVRALRDVLGGEVAVRGAGDQERRMTGAEERDREDETQTEDRPSRERETMDRDSDEGFRFGDANVIEADMRASNGVLHVIDAVVETSAPERQERTGDMDRGQQQDQQEDQEQDRDTVETDTTRTDSTGTGG